MAESHLIHLLPGAYVLGLVILAAGALRRWFDPLPWRTVAVFCAVLVVLFGPALFAGKILLPLENLRGFPPFQDLPPTSPRGFRLQHDQLMEFPAYLTQARRCLRRLEWPLLNPLVGAGEPLLSNTQAQNFHPLIVLAWPFSIGVAAGVTNALRVAVALVFAFLLFRRLGLSAGPALAGSLAYGMGGYVLLYLGWPLANSGAFLPFVLYGLALAIDRGWRRDLVLLAIATGSLLLGGHPETIAHAVVTGFAFAVVRIAGQRPRRRAWGALLRVAATTLLAAALVAPVLLPAVRYLPQSYRYQRLVGQSVRAARAERSDEPASTLRRSLPTIAPDAFGNNRYGHYWGSRTILQDASGFVGTAAALAVLLALGPVRGKRFPAERLMLALGLVALLLVARPPGLPELLDAVPGLGLSASYHRRVTLVLCLCGAYVAACTWERWKRHGLRRSAVLLAAGALGALITWAYLAHPHPEHPDVQRYLRLGYLTAQLTALAGAALLLSLIPGGRRQRWPQWALALLVAGELLYVHRDMNPAMPRSHCFPSRPSIEFLQQNLRLIPPRSPLMTRGDAPAHPNLGSDRIVGLNRTFMFNVPVLYGIADVRSASPLTPARLAWLTAPLRESPFHAQYVLPNHPLYDLLGVRYVVAEPERNLGWPLRRVFRANAWIWQRRRPLPRLFLPPIAVAGAEPTWGDLYYWRDQVLAIRDFGKRAVVAAPDAGWKRWRAATGDRSELEIVRFDPARIRAQAHLTAPRLMASGVFQDGGWHLLANRRPTATVVTNGTFVGAWLEPGEQTLDLIYRPPGFVAGCLVAGLAFAAALVWWTPAPPGVPTPTDLRATLLYVEAYGHEDPERHALSPQADPAAGQADRGPARDLAIAPSGQPHRGPGEVRGAL